METFHDNAPSASPLSRAATHWNRHQLDGPMFSIQNGMTQDFVPALPGQDSIASRSQPTTAAHYRLGGKIELEFCYDAGETWVGLRLAAADGSRITYERI